MQKLEVLIEENAFGSVRPVEVVADVPISALMPALIEELRLPQTDLFGKKLVYMLRQSAGGRILPEGNTLLASGVGPGERLALDSYVSDGSVATVVQQGPGQPYADQSMYSSITIADDSGWMLPSPEKNTPALLPPLKKEPRWGRRIFLAAFGATVLAGGASIAYGASNGMLDALVNGLLGQVQTPIQAPANNVQPQPTKPNVPTMARQQTVFTQHQLPVHSISWSPDGTMIASGGDDARVFIWSPDGNVRHNFALQNPVMALAWAPDSQRIVTGSGTRVTFFNALTGGRLGNSPRRHNQPVTSLAWSGQTQQVVSGGQDRRAIIWSTTNYRSVITFNLHTTAVEAVAWSPDGHTVASSSRVVRVWNANSGRELHAYFIDGDIPMRAVAFSPNNGPLAVGGDDGVVRLWNGLVCQAPQGFGNNAQCNDTPQRLQASQKAIRTLAWSPDGRFLAVGGDEGVLSVWQPMQSQKPLVIVAQNAPIASIVWSPDGKQLASAADNTVTTWQLM